MIILKNDEEIEKIKISCYLAAKVLKMIESYVKEGISTNELDSICNKYIIHKLKAIPAPLGYHGFPKSICTSVNHVVCHGIPGKRILKNGDIINIDVAVIKNGYYGDTSKMFCVGTPSIQAKHVIKISYECLYIGINMIKPGMQLGDIGYAIQQHAEKNRCSIVKEYCGHGIGKMFHEDPQILHYGTPGTGEIIRTGMTFTIEPMVNFGKPDIRILPDKWTVVTKDHSLSAQWEHTILVTRNGAEILTLIKE